MQEPVEAQRGHWISWNRSHRLLGAALWVPGTEPRSSWRALNLGAISPHLSSPLLYLRKGFIMRPRQLRPHGPSTLAFLCVGGGRGHEVHLGLELLILLNAGIAGVRTTLPLRQPLRSQK